MFENKESLVRFMQDSGTTRILFKCLAENDNTKQQIYLGGSFEALNQIPFGEIYPDNLDGKQPNYKASLDFYWVSNEGQIERAPRAQLILYPKYPEVRLSGFLQGCSIAPRDDLQPVPIAQRKFNNGKDGRVLILGIRADGKILAYLAVADTSLANELIAISDNTKIFSVIDTNTGAATKDALLAKILEIQNLGWLPGSRLNTSGEIVRYNAPNAGGYTFEAYAGIIPNGRAEPDLMGWELKAYVGTKITLMTPEPDAGYYGVNRVAGFVQKYGHLRAQGDYYFTGLHKCGRTNNSTQLCLVLAGYNADENRIVDVAGGLTLIDSHGEPAAIWTFAKLLEHWGRKHAYAAYIPYRKRSSNQIIEYSYIDPVLLGEGTDFSKFLNAFHTGLIVYDPGSKVFVNDNGRMQVKARNQFRINVSDLRSLYGSFSSVSLH